MSILEANSLRLPETVPFYEDIKHVNAYVRASDNRLFKKIQRYFADQILREFGEKPLRVLDLGTGPGWLPIIFANARPRWDIAALDGSPLMLQAAEENAALAGVPKRIRWLNEKIETTGLPSDSYDLIISQFTLHEMANPRLMFSEIGRLLSKNGVAILHDFERPSPLAMPLVKLWIKFYYAFSGSMRTQALQSLNASYSVPEAEGLMKSFPFSTSIASAWTIACRMILIRISRRKSGYKFIYAAGGSSRVDR